MRVSLGQINNQLVAVAGPAMPSNVGAANNIITQQPYWNQIIGIAQPLGGGVYPMSQASTLAASAAEQYKALPAAAQQSELAQLNSLYAFLPQFLQNAPTVDAWDTANNFDTGISYTQMGQFAQAYLTAYFTAIGVAPPSSGGTSSEGSQYLIGAVLLGIVGLVLLTRG
jgi:hypothetical protein